MEKSELALLCLLCSLRGRPADGSGASRLAADCARLLKTVSLFSSEGLW